MSTATTKKRPSIRRRAAFALAARIAASILSAQQAHAASPTLAGPQNGIVSGRVGGVVGSDEANCVDNSAAIWTTHTGTGPFYLGISTPFVTAVRGAGTQVVLWAYGISWYSQSTRRWVPWSQSRVYYTYATATVDGFGYDWRDFNTGAAYVPRRIALPAGYAWRVTWVLTWTTNGRQTGQLTYLPYHQEIWDTAGAYDVRRIGSYCTTYPTWPT